MIPKSASPERVKGNFDIDGWELTEEVEVIDALPERFKVCDDSWCPADVFLGDDEYNPRSVN